MSGNKSFLWSRASKDSAEEQETSRPQESSTFIFSKSGKRTITPDESDDGHIYGEVEEEQYQEVGLYEEELYNDCEDAGFEDRCSPVSPKKLEISSTRSSNTSGIWSASDQSLPVSDLSYDIPDPIRPFSDVSDYEIRDRKSESGKPVVTVKKAASTGGAIPFKKNDQGFKFNPLVPKDTTTKSENEKLESNHFNKRSFMKHSISVQQLKNKFEELSSVSTATITEDSNTNSSTKYWTLKASKERRSDSIEKCSGNEHVDVKDKNSITDLSHKCPATLCKHQEMKINNEESENKDEKSKTIVKEKDSISNTLPERNLNKSNASRETSNTKVKSDEKFKNSDVKTKVSNFEHLEKTLMTVDHSHIPEPSSHHIPGNIQRNQSFLAKLQDSLQNKPNANARDLSKPSQGDKMSTPVSSGSNTLNVLPNIPPPRPPKSPRLSAMNSERHSDGSLSSKTSNSTMTSSDVSPVLPQRQSREPPPRPPPLTQSLSSPSINKTKLTLPPSLPKTASMISVSSSSSSLTDSPPPSPTTDTPPTPPPISTLPKRSHSTVSTTSRPISTSSNTSEHMYEVLEDYVNEPLYQFYNQNAEELARQFINLLVERTSVVPVAMTFSNDDSQRPLQGHHRTLWSQMPEVCDSGVLDLMDSNVRQLQEAKFEIITSEASYMNSLNILKNHFIARLQTCDDVELSKENRSILFTDIVPVKKASEKFLTALEACKKKDMFLRGICNIVRDAAREDFKVYIRYCSYQKQRERVLVRLAAPRPSEPTTLREYAAHEVNERLGNIKYLENVMPARAQQQSLFGQLLAKLEADPICQGLPMQSFLLVPMQRITKLHLLMDSILNRMEHDDDEYQSCREACDALKQIVHDCNEEVRRVERMEELMQLSTQLEFGKNMKSTALFSSSRWLVKKGKVTEIKYNNELFPTRSLYIFLFNDLLFLARKRRFGSERFTVKDYCNRNEVMLMNTEGALHLPAKFSSGSCLLLTLIHNHNQKKISKLLYFSSESERTRWTEALSPPKQVRLTKSQEEKTEEQVQAREKVQMVVKWSYTASQPDELSLAVGDIISIITKSNDGWYQGVRIRDGESGWFPGNYAVEVDVDRLRSRNQRNDMGSIYYV